MAEKSLRGAGTLLIPGTVNGSSYEPATGRRSVGRRLFLRPYSCANVDGQTDTASPARRGSCLPGRSHGEKIVAGIFHSLWFRKISPQDQEKSDSQREARSVRVMSGGQRAGSPFCYISLTEVRSKQPFELRYVDLNEDKPIFAAKLEIESPNPLETVEAIIPLPSLPTTKAGTFALELLWNDEPLGCHRIRVVEIEDEEIEHGG